MCNIFATILLGWFYFSPNYFQYFSLNRLNKHKTDHELFRFFYLSLHPEWHVTRTKISPINLQCVSYLLVMHHWIEIFLKKKLRWITNKRFTSVIVLYCLELSTIFFLENFIWNFKNCKFKTNEWTCCFSFIKYVNRPWSIN